MKKNRTRILIKFACMQLHNPRVFSISLIFCVILSSCTRDKGSPITCESLNVTYAVDIKPIILIYCATPKCHVTNGLGKGDYTQYNVVKFTVDAGFFQKRVIVDRDMPPAVLLHDTLIQKIKCWLNDGAPDN